MIAPDASGIGEDMWSSSAIIHCEVSWLIQAGRATQDDADRGASGDRRVNATSWGNLSLAKSD
jgi:hypothetical protein